MNLAPGSLYDPAAPWNDVVHNPRCPWNPDSRSDRLVPTHRCAEGHHFNADDLPALEATVNRLTRCPLFCYDDPNQDDGPCDAEIRELECVQCGPERAIGCALGKDVPAPFRVERKDDGLWLRAEGYNHRQAAIRLSDNHGPIVTAAIEEAMARQEQPR